MDFSWRFCGVVNAPLMSLALSCLGDGNVGQDDATF